MGLDDLGIVVRRLEPDDRHAQLKRKRDLRESPVAALDGDDRLTRSNHHQVPRQAQACHDRNVHEGIRIIRPGAG